MAVRHPVFDFKNDGIPTLILFPATVQDLKVTDYLLECMRITSADLVKSHIAQGSMCYVL